MNITFDFINTYKSISNPKTEAGKEIKELNRYYKMSLVVKKENIIGNDSIAIAYDLESDCYLIFIKKSYEIKFEKIRYDNNKNDVERMKKEYKLYLKTLPILHV